MKIYLMIVFAFFAVAQSSAQCTNSKKTKKQKTVVSEQIIFKKLPDAAKLDDEVRVNKYNDDGIIISFEVITVEEKLKQIGAKYVENKLVDIDGNEIRFFKPQIRGTSEGFEADKKHQESEKKRLADLKESYTVIEIFVNPLKFM